MTYFGYFVLYSDRTGKKIVQYFLNTQQFFMRKVQTPCFRKQQTNIEMFVFCAEVFYTRGYVEKNTASTSLK